MAIIQIKSSNPDFSFIIKKNPASGMQLRSIRKGIAYGWYHGTDTYNIYFKDADTDISYKQHRDETFEYLNVSRYNTPLLPLNAIAEFLSATFKNKNEKDKDGYENSFFVNMIHIKYPRYIDFFNKHFTDFYIEIEQHTHKSYKMTIKSNRSTQLLIIHRLEGIRCTRRRVPSSFSCKEEIRPLCGAKAGPAKHMGVSEQETVAGRFRP